MLVSRSPVFYAMLCRKMAEQGDIQVEDARPGDFKQLLSYIYTDVIELHPTNGFAIWNLSKKYIIPGLTQRCIAYLNSILTVTNACLILAQSLVYEDAALIAKCLNMIQLCTETAFKSDAMLNIRNETRMKILDCDALKMDVFNACVRWAKHHLELKQVDATGENIRNVLGDCIRKIGYAIIGIKDFATLVTPVGILRMEEENALFRYMANKEINPPPENFLFTRKCSIFPVELIISDQIETEGITDKHVKVTIISKTNIEMKSLFLGRPFNNTEIITITFGNTSFKVTSKLDIDDKRQEWKLGSPITLRKDQQHALEFTFYKPVVNRMFYVLPDDAPDDFKGDGYVIKRSEIVARDNIVEIKLQSSPAFVPLLGFSYTLANNN